MRAIDTPAGGGSSTPSALGVLVLVIALFMPVSVRAACTPAHSSARLTSTVRSLVDRLNASGLRRFARSGRSGARDEWSGSPVLDWYFDTIESGRALADRPEGGRKFLAALNFAGINLSGEMWVNPVGSRYSAADAIVLARNYCVRTRWEQFVFWGDRDALIRFRQALDLDRWKEILKDFHPTWVFLSNVAYEHSYEFSRPAPGGAFFGATAMPQEPYQQGVAGSLYAQLGSHNAIVEVGEGIAGTLKPNCIPMKPKGRICPGVDWEYYNILPDKKHRFSAVVPMLYVVVDPRTGAILLLGAHD